VVGFSTAAGQSQRLRSANGVHTYNVLETSRDTLESSSTVICRCLHSWRPCVAVAITSYGSSYCSSDLCQPRQERRCSRRSFRVAWTTTCNSLFYGINEGLTSRLQSFQKNAAARLVSGARRYEHITPVLQELHWLPVRRRVDFKMANLVYLSLSSMTPSYLAAECQLVSDEGRRQLRSAASRMCVMRRTCSNYGDRCFAAAAPKLWNNLPVELRQPDISCQ